MEIKKEVADEIEALWEKNKNLVPTEKFEPDAQISDVQVLGAVPAHLMHICVAYIATREEFEHKFRASIRRVFWSLLGEVFPEAGAKVNVPFGKEPHYYHFGVQKDWQVVVFRCKSTIVIAC